MFILFFHIIYALLNSQICTQIITIVSNLLFFCQIKIKKSNKKRIHFDRQQYPGVAQGVSSFFLSSVQKKSPRCALYRLYFRVYFLYTQNRFSINRREYILYTVLCSRNFGHLLILKIRILGDLFI